MRLAMATLRTLVSLAPLSLVASLASVPSLARADPPAPAPAPSVARAPVVVAAIGDSLTDARSHGGKFLDVLRAHCPQSRFDNFGKGGNMVNQMRHRFAAEVFPTNGPAYTHVIVFGGVNDLYSDLTAGRTPAKIEADLTLMYEEAHRHGAKVVAITVAPWGGFTSYYTDHRGQRTLELNRWILAEEPAGAVESVVDAYALLSCGVSTHLCPAYKPPFMDGLHFGDEGHRRLGEALYAKAFSTCS